MLVVTANWALADGTLVVPSRRLQGEFLEALQRAAFRCGARRDGRYEPVERIDVVLAGDTFDALTTTAWLGAIRPWHEGQRAAATRAAVLVAAAARGRWLLGRLAAWGRDGLTVPAADRRGRPVADRTCRVPVRVTLLPGDRDRWIAGAAGRAGRRGVRICAAWEANGIVICHGAELDPLWEGESQADAGRPSLGASLAVDLVARFGGTLRGLPHMWPACRALVARLAAARPLDMPRVVNEWIVSMEREKPVVAAVGDAWRAAVAVWRRQARLADPACEAAFDSIDAVAGWLDGMGRPVRSEPRASAMADLLDPPAPRGPAVGPLVLGHWGAAAMGSAVVGLGPRPWHMLDAGQRGVTVARGVSAGLRFGPTHVVFPDRSRPAVRWSLLGDEEPEAGSIPSAWPAGHRVVEAA